MNTLKKETSFDEKIALMEKIVQQKAILLEGYAHLLAIFSEPSDPVTFHTKIHDILIETLKKHNAC